VLPGTKLTRLLGRGGFGEVWGGKLSDGSSVALKFLDCRNLSPVAVVGEVRALLHLRHLEHPNLIRIYGVSAVAGYVVLSMERADGNLYDLQDVYRESTGRCIAPDHLLDLLEHAAAGLDFLASRPADGLGRVTALQHCDVKPANLLLVGEGLKIADFGLCTSTFASAGRRFMGTPPYAAPEQYEGRTTERSDQYALAVTWCELVAGERVFYPGALREPQGPKMPVDLSKLREREYPVVARALDPRWTHRWPNCREFIAALRQAVNAPRRPRQVIPRRMSSPSLPSRL
jgi:serine/threonine protein kinase